MNRSNVGNIMTNAMQTLNISGTAAAASIRRSIADASTALNAETKAAEREAKEAARQERQSKIDTKREEKSNAQIAEIQARTDLVKAREADLKSRIEARDARAERAAANFAKKGKASKIEQVGTRQAKEVAKKVNADIEWQTMMFGGHEVTGQNIGGIFVPEKIGGDK